MTIYTTLQKDHNEVKKILAKLEKDPLNQELFKQFEEEITTHDKIEEKTFYKALQKKMDKLNIIIDISAEEHHGVANLIKLYHKAKEDKEKIALFQLINKSILGHIDKEENEIFSLAKQYLTDEEAKEIDNKFKAAEAASEKK